MSTAKVTIKLGQEAKDLTAVAGTSIAGSDAFELNMDVTKLTKLQARILLKELDAFIHRSKYPLI